MPALLRKISNEHHAGWVGRNVLVDVLFLRPLAKLAGSSARAGIVVLTSILEDWPGLSASCILSDSRHREPRRASGLGYALDIGRSRLESLSMMRNVQREGVPLQCFDTP